MSARSPFRSHLLQQWTNSRRSPIVVQQWLQQATIDEEEVGVPTSAPNRSSRHRPEHNRRSLHHSSRQRCPDLSSLDSSPSSPSIALAATSWATSLKSKDNKNNEVNHVEKELYSSGLSAVLPFDGEERRKVENDHETIIKEKQEDAFQKTISRSEILLRHSGTKLYSNTLRETTDSLTFTTKNSKKDEKIDRRVVAMAIDRAVTMAKTTNGRDHQQSRTEEAPPPFTFHKLLSSSRSGRQLIDICFRVTKMTTGDEFLARNEREAWSEVPAFLVAIVRDNQRETPAATSSVKKDDDDDDDSYKALDYSPPANEGQLENYASACAAVQTVIHSLGGDGFTTKVNETTKIHLEKYSIFENTIRVVGSHCRYFHSYGTHFLLNSMMYCNCVSGLPARL